MTVASVIGDVDDTFLPTIDDLVLVVRAGGREDATARTVRYWRSRDLISKPSRAGRCYRYPLAALGEVDGIARWGFSQAGVDLLRFARYIEAGTVELAAAREACISILNRFRPAAQEARELRAGGVEAVHEQARAAARSRGRTAVLPRRVRVPFDQRVAALTYVFDEAFDVADKPEEHAEGLRALQRILGMRTGRGGMDRDLSEITPAAEEWRIDLDALIAAVEAATDDAAQCAWRSVEMVCLWFPALLPTLGPYVGAQDVALFDIAKGFAGIIDPVFYAALFSSRLEHRFNKCSADELTAVLAGPRLATMVAELLIDESEHTAETIRTGLRPHQRAQLTVARLAVATRQGP
jgi:hypothetical protein